MKTREPVVTRGRDGWDQTHLSRREFFERVENVRTAMAEEHLDAMFVYGRGDQDGHLCYITNLINKVPNWGLLALITSDTVILRNERSSRTRPVIERGTWVEDIRFVDNVMADIDLLVGDFGPKHRLGIAGFTSLPFRQREIFDDQTSDCQVVDSDTLLENLRKEKSRRERDQIVRAGRILAEVQQAIKTDTTTSQTFETTLQARADRLARLRGVQDFRFLISNPNRTEAEFRPAERILIESDDPISVYTACRYEGYWASCARTFRLDGETPYATTYPEAENVYEGFLEGLRQSSLTAEAVEGLNDLIECTKLELDTAYSLGGGIGLELDERPSLTEDQGYRIAEGTTLSIQLPLKSPGQELVFFCDTIVVGEDGLWRVTADS